MQIQIQILVQIQSFSSSKLPFLNVWIAPLRTGFLLTKLAATLTYENKKNAHTSNHLECKKILIALEGSNFYEWWHWGGEC